MQGGRGVSLEGAASRVQRSSDVGRKSLALSSICKAQQWDLQSRKNVSVKDINNLLSPIADDSAIVQIRIAIVQIRLRPNCFQKTQPRSRSGSILAVSSSHIQRPSNLDLDPSQLRPKDTVTDHLDRSETIQPVSKSHSCPLSKSELSCVQEALLATI